MASCVIEEVTDAFDPTSFDKPLGDLLLKQGADPQKLLGTVFDFLKRKTNFFKGSDAKRRVLEAYREAAGEGDGFKAGFLSASTAAGSTKPTAPAPAASAAPAATAADASPAEAAAAGAAVPSQTAIPLAPQAGEAETQVAAAGDDAGPSKPNSPDIADANEETDQKPKGLKPNAGRGADLEKYSWNQTLSEVTVLVPVPPGTKAKMLDVDVKKKHLRVAVKGAPAPIIDGDLSEPIKPDDCLWNLSDNTVELTLAKQEGMHWWRNVIAGDPEIDTQAVEPENSKLTDLDPETRTTVEKMMFDQRQKALGLPSSDEMNKQAMLAKFMAAHPEMDFSNAKIS